VALRLKKHLFKAEGYDEVNGSRVKDVEEGYGQTYPTRRNGMEKVWRKRSEKHENARKEKNPPIISEKTGFPPFISTPRLGT